MLGQVATRPRTAFDFSQFGVKLGSAAVAHPFGSGSLLNPVGTVQDVLAKNPWYGLLKDFMPTFAPTLGPGGFGSNFGSYGNFGFKASATAPAPDAEFFKTSLDLSDPDSVTVGGWGADAHRAVVARAGCAPCRPPPLHACMRRLSLACYLLVSLRYSQLEGHEGRVERQPAHMLEHACMCACAWLDATTHSSLASGPIFTTPNA